MESRTHIVEQIEQARIIAVVRVADDHGLDELVDAIEEGGISIIEITLTTPNAARWIEHFASRSGLMVGAGTVMTEADAWLAAGAGAQFIASPIYSPAVVAVAASAGLAALPGAYTPTEIVAAWNGGADFVKLFPTPPDPARFIRTVRGPLPSIRLAPSGGIDEHTASPILAAGAAVLNVGSWLTHGADGKDSAPEAVTRRAQALRAAIGLA